jgi:hypothetical protein
MMVDKVVAEIKGTARVIAGDDDGAAAAPARTKGRRRK